jgi:ATP-dependent Clp protease adaptor protein ClpS
VCRHTEEVCTVSNQPPADEPIVTTRPKAGKESRTRRVPPYNVILENDDHHSFEFVMEVLQKALGCALERALQLTLQAHHTGRAVVWTGPKEVAELKAEQMRTFHEVRCDGRQLGPVGCTIEPAPGG